MASSWTNSTKLRITAKLSASLLVPALPIGGWYYKATADREAKRIEVRLRVRIPNVQTIDDLMIEKCKPGDVVLFERRCHMCAAGPLAAFACIVGKQFLCGDVGGKRSNRLSDIGTFEHAVRSIV